MKSKTSYGGLDYFRVIAAFLVVAIHVSPLESFSTEADLFLTRTLARTAVPFFLTVTGQFVLTDCMLTGEDPSRAVPRFVKKCLLLYVLSVFLYFPIGLYAGHYDGLTPLAALRMLIFEGTFYHLWYFPACITGVLLVRLLRRFLPASGVFAVSAVLYAAGLFGDSYYGTIAGTFLEPVYRAGFSLFSTTRNGIFFAPLFLVLGAAFGREERSGTGNNGIFDRLPAVLGGLAVSLAMLAAEFFVLHRFNLQRTDCMYIALFPVILFLYRFLLMLRPAPSRFCRTFSAWIYILHPAVIAAVTAARRFPLLSVFAENSLLRYLAVCAGSALVCAPLALFLNRREEPDFLTGRAWIELSRKALRHNVRTLRALLPEDCALMPAVKADAYGHGAVLIARELNRLGVHSFCVAAAAEGAALRKAGIRGEILVLGYTHPRDFRLLRRFRLTQTVVDYSYAERLNRRGTFHVHVALDTGMHRLGERSESTEHLLDIFRMKHLRIDGMFTHLCVCDSDRPEDRRYTLEQADAFYRAVDELEQNGVEIPRLHLLSSSGIFRYPKFAEDYARVGIALYGVLSTGEETAAVGASLRPVLSLKARIASVRTLRAGESAGYGLRYTAPDERRIAALSVGYADGLPRSLGEGVGSVLIEGRRAPIIGRICMDQTLVDVTDIPDAHQGGIAVLIGRSGDEEITACDLAEQAGTITNEILSRLGGRLARRTV